MFYGFVYLISRVIYAYPLTVTGFMEFVCSLFIKKNVLGFTSLNELCISRITFKRFFANLSIHREFLHSIAAYLL